MPQVSPAYFVRKATISDIEHVQKFDSTDDETCFQVPGSQAYYKTLCSSENIYLAFDLLDTPIGYIRVDKIWPERVPLLSWVYVTPTWRNKRVGAALVERAKKDLQMEGYETVLMSACTRRPNMIEYFRNKGLIEAGKLVFPNGTEEIFFWQPL
jgi:N-acetylglutamate synthase-like GNAT family acetyltransferase